MEKRRKLNNEGFVFSGTRLLFLLLLLLFCSHTAAGRAPVDSEHVRRSKTTNTCQIKNRRKKNSVYQRKKKNINVLIKQEKLAVKLNIVV